MADQFIEGFDKYGPVGMGAGQTNLTSLLTASEWTSSAVSGSPAIMQIVAGLSTPGQALQIAGSALNPAATTLSKTLGSNIARIIGGVRLSATIGANVPNYGIVFSDAGTNQVSIVLNGSSGQFSVVSGGTGGTTLGTSTASVSSGVSHYLEWDITIGNAGAAYELWLDGAVILNATGNTRGGTSNNSVNGIAFTALGSSTSTSNSWTLDDLYVFDTTGGVNNAVLLTSPRVETQLGTADSTVQFSSGATVIGQDYSLTNTTNAPGANQIFLRKFTPAVNMTLNSVSCLPEATSAGANFKSVLYTDSGGGPNTLVATGTQTTGTTSGTKLTSSFSSGQALTGGTPYWIGFITDTSVVLALVDSGITGQSKANTYGSGAPATLSGMTTGQSDWLLVGNCTASASNYPAVTNNPPLGDDAYVTSTTPGNEDLFTFPALTNAISAIYTVAMKAYVRKTDGGARTMNLDVKSGATDGNGSATGLTMSTSYSWITSYFDTDPNTALAWTATALNAATSGYKIVT